MCDLTQYQFTYETVEAAAADGYTVAVTEHLKMRQHANRVMIDKAIKDLGTLPNCIVINMKERTFAVYRKPPIKFV